MRFFGVPRRQGRLKTEKAKNWFNNLVASPPLTPPIFFNKLLIFRFFCFFFWGRPRPDPKRWHANNALRALPTAVSENGNN
jgi:hypothetical protein